MGEGLQRARAAARNTKNTTQNPVVGQRWRDGDTRANIVREVVIVELGEREKKSRGGDSYGASIKVPSARCKVYLAGKDSGRETWIALSSFEYGSRKFILVGDGAPPQMPGAT